MFPFIPEYTHEYIFRSTGSRDTVGYIYDADGKCIVSDNDSGGNNQFQITYTLTAGQIYYFGAKFYSSSSGGTIPVLLMYGKHSCTKNENGQYVCTACGKVAPSVALGERLDVDVAAWETMEIPFIPEYTHAYIFRSTGSGGTFGYINDADGNRLTSDNDSGGNSQFQITYTLTAGQTYYLGVKWDSSTSSGTIPVLLTYGAHSFTKNESGQYVCTCGETAEVDKLDITLDQTLGVNVEAGETVTISFTPEVTHEYIFRSIGSGDTEGYIYDGYGTHPSGSNHNSEKGQFKTTCTLTAGQTYYLRVRWKDSSKSGMIPVRLTYGDHIYTKRENGRYVCTCGETAQYTIKLDQTVNVDVALGEKVRIPFVPEITHQYVFCSTGSGAPYGYIYDAAGKQIASNGSSGGNKQFKITCTLTAGQTYYLGAGWPNYGDSGTIPVLLTYGAHSYAKNESGQYVCTCGATRLEEGTCGDGVTWRIEGDRLIISGNGAMENYSYSSNVPWSEMKREITEIVVEEGVFLKEGDFSIYRPTDQRQSVEAGWSFPGNLALKVPANYGGIFGIQKFLDVPAQNLTAPVPVPEPAGNHLPPVILRPPALNVCGVLCEEIGKLCFPAVQPKGKPFPNGVFSLLHSASPFRKSPISPARISCPKSLGCRPSVVSFAAISGSFARITLVSNKSSRGRP